MDDLYIRLDAAVDERWKEGAVPIIMMIIIQHCLLYSCRWRRKRERWPVSSLSYGSSSTIRRESWNIFSSWNGLSKSIWTFVKKLFEKRWTLDGIPYPYFYAIFHQECIREIYKSIGFNVIIRNLKSIKNYWAGPAWMQIYRWQHFSLYYRGSLVKGKNIKERPLIIYQRHKGK